MVYRNSQFVDCWWKWQGGSYMTFNTWLLFESKWLHSICVKMYSPSNGQSVSSLSPDLIVCLIYLFRSFSFCLSRSFTLLSFILLSLTIMHKMTFSHSVFFSLTESHCFNHTFSPFNIFLTFSHSQCILH